MSPESSIRADVVLAEMRAGFMGLNIRVDDLREAQQQVNSKAATALQLIAGHDEAIRTLTSEIARIRDEREELAQRKESELRDRLIAALRGDDTPAKDKDRAPDLDHMPITVGFAKLAGQYGGWLLAGGFGLLKLVGKL